MTLTGVGCTMNKLLDVKSLTVSYGERDVLKDITMSMNEKEIIAIVGESGCGKTTFIKAILHILSTETATSGDILFDGRDVSKWTKQQWQTIRGKEIGLVFQNPGSFFNPIMKIGKQFIEAIRSHEKISKAEAKETALSTLQKMDFSKEESQRIYHAYPFELSGGMKQRVAIAMAVALGPKLILADEPTSALDVCTQQQVMDELLKIREQFHTGMLLVTHNIGLAAYMADRIMVMQNGQVIEFAETARIIEQPRADYTKKLLQAVPELKGGS